MKREMKTRMDACHIMESVNRKLPGRKLPGNVLVKILAESYLVKF